LLAVKTILIKKEDVEEQLRQAIEIQSSIESGKIAIQKELESASEYIIQHEARFYQSQQTSIELLKQLKFVEAENNELVLRHEEQVQEIQQL